MVASWFTKRLAFASLFLYLLSIIIYPKIVGGRTEDICLNFLPMRKDSNYKNI